MTSMAERDRMPNMVTGEMMDLGRPAAAPRAPVPQESFVAGNEAARSLLPQEYGGYQGAPQGPISSSVGFDYGRAFNPAYQPGAVEYKAPQIPPTVAPSATTPRPPVDDGKPGVVAQAAGMQPPKQNVFVIGQPTQDNNRFDLAMMQAKEGQAALDRNAAMRQGAADAARMTTREDDLRMRHALMKAMDSGSSVLNYAWGQDTARAEAMAQRPGVQNPALALGALNRMAGGDPLLGRNAPGAPAAGRNLIQEQLAEEQMREQRATGQSQRAGGAIAQEAEKLKLAQQQRISTISQQLFEATDPKQRESLSQNLLSLMGKDKPEEYAIHTVSMPDTVDPATGAALKGGQALAIVNKSTGAREIVQLSGPGQAQSAPPANHIEALKKDPKLAAQFDAKYGAGAAAKILGAK